MVAVEAAVSGHVARIAEVGGAQGLRLPEPGVAAADPTDVEDPGFRAVWVGLALTKAGFIWAYIWSGPSGPCILRSDVALGG